MHPSPLVTLDLPAPDEYGNRPAVTQEELKQFLVAAGMRQLRTPGEAQGESIQWLRAQAREERQPVLLSLLAAEVPDLVPHALADSSVWYFALPDSMDARIPELVDARLSCFGGLTGDPWRHAVFLCLAEGAEAGSETEMLSMPGLAFEADSLNLSGASSRGYVIALFDCAGSLHARGIPIGEEILMDLSACDASSFQRPLRMHAVRNLQARTRTVEETGVDPDGPPGNGNLVVPALSSPAAQKEPWQIPPHLLHRLPPVSWHGMPSAVIGWLPEVTYFPGDCAGESPLVLKVTVKADVFDKIRAGEFSARVQRVAVPEHGCGAAYVLLVDVLDQVCVVALPAYDARFRGVYDYWARHGSCSVAFENYRNGRLHRIRQEWPATFGAEPGGCPEGERVEHAPMNLLLSEGVRGLVESLARERGRRLTCYVSDVMDQSEWVGRDD